MGDAYWGAYRASKVAFNQIAASYAAETQQAGFKVDVFDPGVMATQLRRNAYPGENQDNLTKPMDVALKYVNG